MEIRKHNHGRLTTGKESPACLKSPELARNNQVVVEEEAQDPLPAEPLMGDDGDDGDNHGPPTTTGNGGYGVIERDLVAVVDAILADLPEPTQHHIIPKLEEFNGARQAI